MPKDYKEVVFDIYKEKKAKMDLSSNLLEPTPGNLRAECLIVCREKYSSKDHEVLRLFFSDGDKEKGYLKSIENSPAEKFKQMSKILKGADVKKPGVKYFELLEWLMDLKLGTSTVYYKSFYEKQEVKEDAIIEVTEEKFDDNKDDANDDKTDVLLEDFQNDIDENGRIKKVDEEVSDSPLLDVDNERDKPTIPVIVLLDNGKTKAETVNVLELTQESRGELINTPETSKGNQVVEKKEPNPPTLNFYDKIVEWLKAKINSKNKKAIASFVLIAIAGGGSYAFLKNTDQCMYWTGTQYQSVGCSVKVDHATVIALDQHKVDRLKRITRLDTLAEKDLGKVWYVKIKQDSAEFYTDSGNYPLNNKKVLMPMTKYILDKYILHK